MSYRVIYMVEAYDKNGRLRHRSFWSNKKLASKIVKHYKEDCTMRKLCKDEFAYVDEEDVDTYMLFERHDDDDRDVWYLLYI